jgi:hypothetical protein
MKPVAAATRSSKGEEAGAVVDTAVQWALSLPLEKILVESRPR